MKLIILHGNALSAISVRISVIKKDFDSLAITERSGKETSWDQIIMEVSTPQLFSPQRLLLLEDFDEKIDLKRLPNDENLTVLVKFTKPLAANSIILKSAMDIKAQIIPLTEKDETSIFPFLDDLAEKNKKSLPGLNPLLEEFGGQYILTMIFYMLRRLIMPTGNLPNYVQQKITRQKNNFSEEKIKEIYQFALETDYKMKTGLVEEKMGLSLIVDKILTI